MKFKIDYPIENTVIAIHVEGSHNNQIAFSEIRDRSDLNVPNKLEPGVYHIKCSIPRDTLSAGYFQIIPNIGIYNKKRFHTDASIIKIRVLNVNGLGRDLIGGSALEGLFRPSWQWSLDRIQN
jgi:hypothetical protein